MRRPDRWGTTLTLCVILAATSCSEDPTTLLRSDYLEQVNALCGATTATIDAALVPVIESYISGLGAAGAAEQDLTDEQVTGLYAATRPVAEGLNEEFAAMLASIRALPPPDSDAALFAEHWSRVEALWIEAYEAIVIASSDPVAARLLLAEPDPRLSPTNDEAVTLGIDQCVFE